MTSVTEMVAEPNGIPLCAAAARTSQRALSPKKLFRVAVVDLLPVLLRIRLPILAPVPGTSSIRVQHARGEKVIERIYLTHLAAP